MAKFNNPMKVITGPDTLWSYCNVWERSEEHTSELQSPQ